MSEQPAEQAPQIEHSIEIDASPQRVWEIVSDVRNATEWSATAAKVLAVGATKKGTWSLNINKEGPLVWPTTARVVDFVPGRRIANRINENFTVWAFEIEPVGAGTRLIERRETPNGISGLSKFLVKRVFGGQEKFQTGLQTGVSTSLKRIKALAESGEHLGRK